MTHRRPAPEPYTPPAGGSGHAGRRCPVVLPAGTHTGLLDRGGLYATLYERQFLAHYQPAASQAVTI
jgi:hypothetical protein